MLESMKFTYDGISSDDMGVVLVYDGAGTINESLFGDRQLITQNIPNTDTPIFKRIENSSRSFTFNLWIKEWKERNNLRAISRWLFQNEYKPLIFESNTDLVYYGIFNGSFNLEHNGDQSGVISTEFTCDSTYAYSLPKINLISVRGSETRSYFNEGDVSIRPQLKITKIGDGDISIKNNRNNQELILRDLFNNEIVYINCENEEIKSSLEEINNRYLFDNHNDVWLDFDFNHFKENIFTFNGDFECEFIFEYKYLNQDIPIYFE